MCDAEPDRLDKIEELLKDLTCEVGKLGDLIRDQQTSCNRMDDHIDFVEGVYDKVRHPLSYITGKNLNANNRMRRIE